MTKPRLVVIDDDNDLREALCDTLSADGFDVSGFSDATEAVRRIESGLPADLILLDLMMPIMNGWQFCQYRATSAGVALSLIGEPSVRSAPRVGCSTSTTRSRAMTCGSWKTCA